MAWPKDVGVFYSVPDTFQKSLAVPRKGELEEHKRRTEAFRETGFI